MGREHAEACAGPSEQQYESEEHRVGRWYGADGGRRVVGEQVGRRVRFVLIGANYGAGRVTAHGQVLLFVVLGHG
jgi:hypothetical protein